MERVQRVFREVTGTLPARSDELRGGHLRGRVLRSGPHQVRLLRARLARRLRRRGQAGLHGKGPLGLPDLLPERHGLPHGAHDLQEVPRAGLLRPLHRPRDQGGHDALAAPRLRVRHSEQEKNDRVPHHVAHPSCEHPRTAGGVAGLLRGTPHRMTGGNPRKVTLATTA